MSALDPSGWAPIALDTGEGMLVAAVLLILLGVAMSLMSCGGSGIDAHPRGLERGQSTDDKTDALDGTR
jgi:hypothetical protein